MDSKPSGSHGVYPVLNEMDFEKAPWRSASLSKQSIYCVFKDPSQIFRAVCDEFIRGCSQAIQLRGKFHAVLTGGATPAQFYDLVAKESNSTQIDWKRVYLYLSDDRFVPHSNELSNAAMVDRHLISKVPIPERNVVRINCEQPDIVVAAKEYEDAIVGHLGNRPRFDFVLAGLGADGHTASLFPGIPQLNEEGVVHAVAAPTHIEPHVARITLSLNVLRDAWKTYFIATGSSKQPVLKSIINDLNAAKKRYPAAMVADGNDVVWMVDELAAGFGN